MAWKGSSSRKTLDFLDPHRERSSSIWWTMTKYRCWQKILSGLDFQGEFGLILEASGRDWEYRSHLGDREIDNEAFCSTTLRNSKKRKRRISIGSREALVIAKPKLKGKNVYTMSQSMIDVQLMAYGDYVRSWRFRSFFEMIHSMTRAMGKTEKPKTICRRDFYCRPHFSLIGKWFDVKPVVRSVLTSTEWPMKKTTPLPKRGPGFTTQACH